MVIVPDVCHSIYYLQGLSQNIKTLEVFDMLKSNCDFQFLNTWFVHVTTAFDASYKTI